MTQELIKDAVKGSILALALYFVWNAFLKQVDQQNERINYLETKIDNCNGEQRKQLEQTLIDNNRILTEIKNNYEFNRKN
jgi:uncharacterized protein (DUF111 family)